MDSPRRLLVPRGRSQVVPNHGDKWLLVERATGTSNALQHLMVETRMRGMSSRSSRGSTLSGHPGSQLAQLYTSWERCSRYCQARDAEEHARTVKVARAELRNHPDVLRQIGRFWDCALAYFPRMTADLAPGQTPGLMYEEYHEFQMRFAKVLLTDFNAARARAYAKHDFLIDLQGEDLVRKRQFYDSVFALADAWTLGVHPAEYALFLAKLYDAIAYEFQGKARLQEFSEIETSIDISRHAQQCFSGRGPRSKVNGNVYSSSTTAHTQREMDSKAARQSREAAAAAEAEEDYRRRHPESRPTTKLPSPSETTAAQALVWGRLRTRAHRKVDRTHRPSSSVPQHLRPRPPPDAREWFDRAQRWLVDQPSSPVGTMPKAKNGLSCCGAQQPSTASFMYSPGEKPAMVAWMGPAAVHAAISAPSPVSLMPRPLTAPDAARRERTIAHVAAYRDIATQSAHQARPASSRRPTDMHLGAIGIAG